MKYLLITCALLFSSTFSFAQSFADPVLNSFDLNPKGNRTSPAFADIDQDNDQDMFTGLVSGDFGFFENLGTNELAFFSTLWLGPYGISSIGGDATPFLVDLDNDGDFDLMSGGDGGLRYYENVGTAVVASYGPETQNPFNILTIPSGISKPYLADMDNDDDMDLFSGSSDGNLYYFQNIGTVNAANFAAALTNPFGLENVGLRSAPSLVDLDMDGDLDMLVGNKTGEFRYFENTGTAVNAAFTYIGINPFGLQNVNDDAKPTFADMDNDGDQDLVSGSSNGDYYYYRNTTITGIETLNKLEFSVHPNPTRDKLYLELGSFALTEDLSLTLSNALGAEVKKINVKTTKLEIDLSAFSAGVYHLSLHSGAKTLAHEKIVIQD